MEVKNESYWIPIKEHAEKNKAHYKGKKSVLPLATNETTWLS